MTIRETPALLQRRVGLSVIRLGAVWKPLKYTMFDRTALKALEELIALAAAEELMPRYQRVEAKDKADGTLLTEADLQMQARIQRELAEAWPDIEFLGEEMTAEQQQALIQQTGKGLWVLDPLDGTSNFASGIPFFGVSLALIVDGMVQAGVVYDPVRNESFSALRGEGAWLNGERMQVSGEVSELKRAMAMVDLKRLPGALVNKLCAHSPYRSQRSFGSVALDWCWMAAERMQVYTHGGQKLWDYAAGSLVMAEAGGLGGVFEDYAGTPVAELTLKPRIAIAATQADLFDEWAAWLQEGAAS